MTDQTQGFPANETACPPLAEDLLRGADEIAAFMFGSARHRRKIYYLTGEATRGLPHFKMGSLICARKSTLLRWIAEQEERK